MFRQFNEREIELIGRLARREKIVRLPSAKGTRIDYQVHHNLTLAIILNGKYQWLGATKRNPGDKWSDEIGRDVALADALGHEAILIKH